jgi:dienelactone hydrolase
MSEGPRIEDIRQKTVVLRIDGMESAAVERDVPFAGDGGAPLGFDIYRPADADPAQPLPAVILVPGYRGEGFRSRIGCDFKQMGSVTSWARLFAASGLAAIAGSNREPVGDAIALAAHVQRNGASLGVDAARLGLWAASGNVPTALRLLIERRSDPIRCAALWYGYTLDLPGATHVADGSRQFGYANACAGRSVEEIPAGTALFFARAGLEESPGLNESLDRFAAAALARNLPLTLVNHPAGRHAFDLFQDDEASRHAVRQALAFSRFQLGARPGPETLGRVAP